MPRPSTKTPVTPRLKKFSVKRLMEVLKYFQKIHSFANINVIARESNNPVPMVEMEMERLAQQEQVTIIEVVSHHPQTGELGKETCYRLGRPPKMRFSDVYMMMVNKDIEKEKPRRRGCTRRRTAETDADGCGSGKTSKISRSKSGRRPRD